MLITNIIIIIIIIEAFCLLFLNVHFSCHPCQYCGTMLNRKQSAREMICPGCGKKMKGMLVIKF